MWYGDVVAAAVVAIVVVVVVVAIVVVVPIVVVVAIAVVVPIVVVECSRTHRLVKDIHMEAGHRKAAAIEEEEADTEEPKSMEEVLVVQVEAQIQPGSPKYGIQRELHL